MSNQKFYCFFIPGSTYPIIIRTVNGVVTSTTSKEVHKKTKRLPKLIYTLFTMSEEDQNKILELINSDDIETTFLGYQMLVNAYIKPSIFPKIEGIEVTESHLNNLVMYIPPHAEGNIMHKDSQLGVLNSYREDAVFIRYTRGDTAANTPTDNLVWVTDDMNKQLNKSVWDAT